MWFSEAEKYNGLPLADLNVLETLSRWRPYLSGTRESYFYYPGTADVGMGAAVEIQGRSFVVIAEVTVDTTGAEGVIVKHGGAHGGHVMFYYDLARHLGPDQPLYGLQAQGLDGSQEPQRSFEEMASHYIEEMRAVQPEGPYHLGGDCLGGVIAYEAVFSIPVPRAAPPSASGTTQ